MHTSTSTAPFDICVLLPTGALRVQTSKMAKMFVTEKIEADPTGTVLQKRIREQLLDLIASN